MVRRAFFFLAQATGGAVMLGGGFWRITRTVCGVVAVFAVLEPGAAHAQYCQSPDDISVELVGAPRFPRAGRETVRGGATVAISGERRSCDVHGYSFEIWTDTDRVTWNEEAGLVLEGIAYRGQPKRYRIEGDIDNRARDVRLVWCVESFAWEGSGAPPCATLSLGDTPLGATDRRRDDQAAAAAAAAAAAEAARLAEERRQQQVAAEAEFRQALRDSLATAQADLAAGQYETARSGALRALDTVAASDSFGSTPEPGVVGQLEAVRDEASRGWVLATVEGTPSNAPLPREVLQVVRSLPDLTRASVYQAVGDLLEHRWSAGCAAESPAQLAADLGLVQSDADGEHAAYFGAQAITVCLSALPEGGDVLAAWEELSPHVSRLGVPWGTFAEPACWRLFSAWQQGNESDREAAGLQTSTDTISRFAECLRQPEHRQALAAAEVNLAASAPTEEMEVRFADALQLDPGNAEAQECLLAGAGWRRLSGNTLPHDPTGAAVDLKVEELQGDLTSYWNLALSIPVPGLGQIMTGRIGWGVTYLVTTLALAGSGGLTYYFSTSAYDDYVAASAVGDPAAESHWSDAESYWQASLGLWIAAAAIWAVNLLDAGLGIRSVREEEATYEWALLHGCPAVRDHGGTAVLPVLCW
jgi:hypothetical protein